MKCAVCEKEVPQENMFKCEYCGADICQDCYEYYEGTIMCPACFNTEYGVCEHCDKFVKQSDLENCPVCGRVVCINCMSACSNCFQNVCPNCLIENVCFACLMKKTIDENKPVGEDI